MRTKLTLQAATAAFAMLVPAIAAAQPGAAPPPPPPNSGYQGGYQGYYSEPYSTTTADGFWLRQGWTAGASFGLGGLDTDSGVLDCFECDYDPAAVGVQFHLGYMINPRVALLGEFWAQFQQIDADGFGTGYQSQLFAAAQFWVTPQLWLKGGLGVSSLGVTYDDGYGEELAAGTAIMAAAGYELYSAPDVAVDLQLRLGSGNYNGVDDRAQAAMLSVGLNWY